MNILPSCKLCGNSFTPRNSQQRYCLFCVHKGCEICGAKKDTRGRFCKKCDSANRIGKACPWNRHEDKSIEQIIVEVEAFGLLPEKQYAFGYVIGVMFGDGSISKVMDNVKFTRTNGTVRVFPQESYRPMLSVTSQTFAERFVYQWKMLTGRSVKVWAYIRTDFSKSTLKGHPLNHSAQIFVVHPRHVLLGRYLAHLKYESNLYELLRFPLEVMRGFLHGMIDSEGYVRGRRIDIANKNATLLDILALMLDLLGHTANIYTYPSQNVSHLVTYMAYSKYQF